MRPFSEPVAPLPPQAHHGFSYFSCQNRRQRYEKFFSFFLNLSKSSFLCRYLTAPRLSFALLFLSHFSSLLALAQTLRLSGMRQTAPLPPAISMLGILLLKSVSQPQMSMALTCPIASALMSTRILSPLLCLPSAMPLKPKSLC